MTMRILVIGENGMLAHTLFGVLCRDSDIRATLRKLLDSYPHQSHFSTTNN